MSEETRQNADLKMVELIARGTTQAEAARLCGCSPRTVARRLDDAEFVAQVDQYRQHMLEASAGRLAAMVETALDGLRDLLQSDVPPAVRLAACRCLLDSCLRFSETLSVERRLAALEGASNDGGSHADER